MPSPAIPIEAMRSPFVLTGSFSMSLTESLTDSREYGGSLAVRGAPQRIFGCVLPVRMHP